MKLKSKDLSIALAECSRAMKTRTTMPVLACVGMEARDGILRLKATNYDVWIGRTADCEGDLPPCCVDLRKLSALAESSGGGEVEIQLDGKLRFDVKALRQFNVLPVVDPAAFPAWPQGKSTAIGTRTDDLADAIESVSWATISESAGRSNLENVYVRLLPTFVECYAFSGIIFARYSKPSISAEKEFFVPHDFTPALVSALRQPESELYLAENYAGVGHKFGTTLVKLSELAWVGGWEKILEKQAGNGFASVPSSVLKTACSRAILFAEASKTAELSFNWKEDGSLEMKASGYEQTVQLEDAIGEGWAQLNAVNLNAALGKLGETVRFTPADGVSFWETNELLVAIAQIGEKRKEEKV